MEVATNWLVTKTVFVLSADLISRILQRKRVLESGFKELFSSELLQFGR